MEASTTRRFYENVFVSAFKVLYEKREKYAHFVVLIVRKSAFLGQK